ncbi:hypothetical protein ACFVZR_12670 [Streptomyces sp. NPDC058316]|uniref:hypothetical protein n=1 Tax=unclassified Streptomyces TaxID=2593676 RepID=UPI0036EDD21D
MAHETTDHVLAQLVRLVNGGSYEFSITLTVTGQTVTGKLISSKKWFELLAGTCKASTQAEEGQVGLHSIFEGWADLTVEYNNELKRAQEALEGVELPDRYMKAVDEAEVPVGFIHLEEARIDGSGGYQPVEGMPWRGRLEHVSGWSLGELKASRN